MKEKQFTEKTYIVRCYYCGEDTEITVQIPQASSTGVSRTKEKEVLCDHCKHVNLITISRDMGVHPPVLGDDNDLLGYSKGIPIVQGKKP